MGIALKKIENNILFCLKELYNIDYFDVQLANERKNSNNSVGVSPRGGHTAKNTSLIKVDKNLLDIGNATLKIKSDYTFE